MSETIILWSISIAMILLAVSMLLCLGLMIRGPKAQDRILGLDTLYVISMLMLLVFGIRYGDVIFFEVALIIGIFGFVATVATAKFLMRGEVIE